MVTVREGARLSASATAQGDGGLVVVWSDNATRFFGQADSRGGALGGNGGLVEVSGKGFLDFRGGSDRSAPVGKSGTLLLDPVNLTIGTVEDLNGDGTAGDAFVPGPPDPRILAFDAAGPNSQISAATVTSQLLNNGSLELQATGLITVNNAITVPGGDSSLTLRASGNVVVTAPISLTGGTPGTQNITLAANHNFGATGPATGTGAVTLAAGANLSSSGTVTISNAGSSAANQISANITAAALSATTGALNLVAPSLWTLSGASTVSANLTGAGALSKAGVGALTLSGANNAYTGAIAVNAGSLVANGGAALGDTSAITVGAAGTLVLGASETAGSLAGVTGAALTLAANTLSVGANNSSTDWAGSSSGGGGPDQTRHRHARCPSVPRRATPVPPPSRTARFNWAAAARRVPWMLARPSSTTVPWPSIAPTASRSPTTSAAPAGSASCRPPAPSPSPATTPMKVAPPSRPARCEPVAPMAAGSATAAS